MQNTKLTYKDAGVDIQAGNALVDRIKTIAAKTSRTGLLGGIGGFGALFELPLHRYQNPVLVSSTDGVGTKLKLAIDLNYHETIGIDLVAMCVNDIIVQGAEPLFFLDYFATGKLDLPRAESIIRGIGKGCEIAKVALVGGETAEMPGLYAEQDYDLAGFVVGIVEKNRIITGNEITHNDVLIALSSSGLHSNGYSLVCKILELQKIDLNGHFENGKTFGEILLIPTRIYVDTILTLLQQIPIKGLAHITGGGITENLVRILPPEINATIDSSSWTMPKLFQLLQHLGNIDDAEMGRTFNCGIGMIMCVAPEQVKETLTLLANLGEDAWVIGKTISAKSSHRLVEWA